MGNTLDLQKSMDKTQDFEGQLLPPYFAHIKESCKNFEVRDSDVWLCCFPKTGSSWLHEILWLITHDYDYEGAKEPYEYKLPLLERKMLGVDPGFLLLITGKKENERFVSDTIAYLNTLDSPRVIRSHLNWNNLPKQLTEGSTNAKIVYLTRNPKDTCLSLLHFSRLIFGTSDTVEEAAKKFCTDKVQIGPFFDHILPFWARRTFPNVLFLTYEEMKADLRLVILKIIEFLDRTITDEQMEKLLQHLTIENMRSNKAVNNEELIQMMKSLLKHKFEGQFIHKGQVGNYKNRMSPETIKMFDDWTAKNLRGTGFYFKS